MAQKYRHSLTAANRDLVSSSASPASPALLPVLT